MQLKIRFLFTFLVFLFISSSMSAQIVRVKGTVLQISQSSDGSIYAVSDNDSVTLYDAADFSVIAVINEKKAVKTSFNMAEDGLYIIIMTENGMFSMRKLEKTDGRCTYYPNSSYYQADCSGKTPMTARAFSSNSDYVAAAYNDKSIQLHFRLRVTQSSITKSVKEHSTAVYGLEFSRNGEYLASVSKDGTAHIWNTWNMSRQATIKNIYTKSLIPVYFSADSDYIICMDGRTSFRVCDLTGKILYSVMTGHSIVSLKPLKDPDLIAVLDDKNEFMIYSISDRIPILSASAAAMPPITAFEFNDKATYALVGCETGAVYAIETQEYTDLADLIRVENGGSAVAAVQRFSSFSLCAGANYLNAPYLLSGNFRFEYKYCKKTAPWYIGAGALAQVGFPRNEFPYSYEMNGEAAKPPYFCSAAVYIPTGFIFSPWGNSIFFKTDLRVGAKVNSIAFVSNSHNGYMVGNPSYSFFAGGGLGMILSIFEFDVNCEYDTIGKVTPSAYAGICIKRGVKK